MVDAEKENNLPKSELYKRKFYKSLSKGKIEELKALSTSLDEINVNSREVKAYEKDLEREKENAIATAKEIDKITRDFHRFMALMENQSYAPINATSVLDPLMRSLNEWQQNLNQQRTASRQNYNMMQMNNSLNNIASSLNSIDSTLKY